MRLSNIHRLCTVEILVNNRTNVYLWHGLLHGLVVGYVFQLINYTTKLKKNYLPNLCLEEGRDQSGTIIGMTEVCFKLLMKLSVLEKVVNKLNLAKLMVFLNGHVQEPK